MSTSGKAASLPTWSRVRKRWTGKVTQAQAEKSRGSGNYNPNFHQMVQTLNSRSTELPTGRKPGTLLLISANWGCNHLWLKAFRGLREIDVYLISRQVSLSHFQVLLLIWSAPWVCEVSDLLICWLKLLIYTLSASVSTVLMPGAQGGPRGCCMPWDWSCDGCEHHVGLGTEYPFCGNITGAGNPGSLASQLMPFNITGLKCTLI